MIERHPIADGIESIISRFFINIINIHLGRYIMALTKEARTRIAKRMLSEGTALLGMADISSPPVKKQEYIHRPGALVTPDSSASERLPCRSKSWVPWEKKLSSAFPGVSIDRLEHALDVFADIFIPRYSPGAIFREKTGSWKSVKVICAEDVINHLSGNPKNPLWVASRGWRTTRRITLDLDLHDNNETAFNKTRQQVAEALNSVGIDINNPRHALVSPSPRGLHIHIFLKGSIFTGDIPRHLAYLGLKLRPGRLEVYPSESHALRVPFGRLPGREHDPLAWLNFVEDFESGKYVLHDWCRLIQARMRSFPTPKKSRTRSRVTQSLSRSVDTNKYTLPSSPVRIPPGYDQIIARGPRSMEEVNLLWQSGILRAGTRHQVLRHLAEHLVWHLRLSPEEAIERLTTWALDPRHVSTEIQSDLANGTDHTKTKIADLVHWHVEKYVPPVVESPRKSLLSPNPSFSDHEIEALRPVVSQAPDDMRRQVALFCLSFLQAARNAGEVARHDNRPGYRVSVAAKVMRSWPAQAHMAYKQSLDLVMSSGLVTIVQEKWQNPRGLGRARTYFLSVPYDSSDHTVSQDDAVALLVDQSVSVNPSNERSKSYEQSIIIGPISGLQDTQPQVGTGRPLGARASERDQIALAVDSLPDPSLGNVSAVRAGTASGEEPTETTQGSIFLWEQFWGQPEALSRLNSALASLLVEDPTLSLNPYQCRILGTPGDQLEKSDLIAKIRLLIANRGRYQPSILLELAGLKLP